MISLRRLLTGLALVLAPCSAGFAAPAAWDDLSGWQVITDGRSTGRLAAGPDNNLQLDYEVDSDGFVLIRHEIESPPPDSLPVVFRLRVNGGGDLEIKFEDVNGSVFGRKLALTGQYAEPTPVVIYLHSLDYWWGGADDAFDGLRAFELAISGGGSGTMILAEAGIGITRLVASFPPPALSSIPSGTPRALDSNGGGLPK